MDWKPLSMSASAVDRRERKFDKWLSKLPRWHEGFVFTPNPDFAWTEPKVPLDDARVALVTTAGVHLQSQPAFDTASAHGDWSYRVIPANTPPVAFEISHTHYDHSDADEDINVMFALERLHEFAAEGIIGEVAPRHFGLMGFIPDPAELVAETAPQVAAALVEDDIDLVLLTPG